MKKCAIVLAVCLFAVALAGCGASPSSSAPASSAAAVSSSTAPSSAPSQAASVSDTSMPAESAIAGTVTDATMNTLQIAAADGTVYEFSTMDAAVEAPEGDGIVIGANVVVYYEGALAEGDGMQNVLVTRVVVE